MFEVMQLVKGKKNSYHQFFEFQEIIFAIKFSTFLHHMPSKQNYAACSSICRSFAGLSEDPQISVASILNRNFGTNKI